jgi:pyruvate dehydrogenase E2 component (dihydrolipoyllysine-residue acetyltransferase)
MGEFLMPSLGADMQAGTLVEWLVKPGDHVKRGDVIAVVETHKGAIEIEMFEEGILDSYLVKIGETVPVGIPLAIIKTVGEAPVSSGEQPVPTVGTTPATMSLIENGTIQKAMKIHGVSETVSDATFSSGHVGPRIRISPAARRLAEKLRLDLDSFRKRGSGPDGAIILADIEAEIAEKSDSTDQIADYSRMSGMRSAIAAAMSRSKKEIPHYYLCHTIDLTNASKFIAESNENRNPANRLLLAALYLKAVALAIKKYPEFNGHFIEDHFQNETTAHIGMAINMRGGGLVAPAIHDVKNLDLDGTMSALRDLVSRVRAGRFRSSELTDPTITISSLGNRGIDTLYGVIYPPQVAIIGIGTPSLRPSILKGELEKRLVANITLAADHRVSDGHRGAQFLKAIDRFLQKPDLL